jgi:hypothetical protein
MRLGGGRVRRARRVRFAGRWRHSTRGTRDGVGGSGRRRAQVRLHRGARERRTRGDRRLERPGLRAVARRGPGGDAGVVRRLRHLSLGAEGDRRHGRRSRGQRRHRLRGGRGGPARSDPRDLRGHRPADLRPAVEDRSHGGPVGRLRGRGDALGRPAPHHRQGAGPGGPGPDARRPGQLQDRRRQGRPSGLRGQGPGRGLRPRERRATTSSARATRVGRCSTRWGSTPRRPPAT